MSGYPVVNCMVRVAAVEKKATEKKADLAKPAASKSRITKAKSAVKSKPIVPIKEDLTRVEGIGRKIEALLYKNKIYNFRQLSKTTITTLKAILEAAGNKYAMHNPGSWPKQAKLAAEGKFEDLELLKKHLKGGK
ncbi:MAG: hypothetical protein IPL84_13340 [Chitinophagaceae bacterium]|nr:hypothetical protein [Chitinophagaceae bacterium]